MKGRVNQEAFSVQSQGLMEFYDVCFRGTADALFFTTNPNGSCSESCSHIAKKKIIHVSKYTTGCLVPVKVCVFTKVKGVCWS